MDFSNFSNFKKSEKFYKSQKTWKVWNTYLRNPLKIRPGFPLADALLTNFDPSERPDSNNHFDLRSFPGIPTGLSGILLQREH